MKRLLIIDDEVDLCMLLSKALKKEAFEVECVHNLGDAEKKMKEHFDVILLDNNLPDGSGLQFFVQYPRKFNKSCVVIISADQHSLTPDEATRAGAAAFIRKPFTVGTLKNTLMELQ